MRRILITGSNGLLGQKLLDAYLSEKESQVIATSKGGNRHTAYEGYIYETVDITDANDINRAIFRYKPTALINTAAMTNVDACENDKEACTRMNVDAVKYMVEACNKGNIHFIHLSTDFIFDGTNGPYKETDTPNPISFYGQSKLDSERYVMENSNNWAIVRTILVYGIVNYMSRSNIVLWVKESLEQGKTINVVDDQYRMPTLAEDLAKGCMLVEKNKANGIFNICGKDYMSIYELAQRVADYWKLDKNLIQRADSNSFTQPARRPLKTGFDLSKSNEVLGYDAHSFEEGLAVLESQLKTVIL